MLQDHQAAVVVELRQRFAVDTLGFLSKPFDKARAIGNFTLGLGIRLALLGGHDAPQVFLIGHEQLVPVHEDGVAFLAGFSAPGRQGRVGGCDRRFGFLRSQVGHICKFLPIGRVVDIKAAVAGHPLAVDQRVGFQKAGVLEQGDGGGFHVHDASLMWEEGWPAG